MRNRVRLLQTKSGRFYSIVFVVVFFVLAALPALHISQEKESVKENRMLAKYPMYFTGGHFNYEFGEQFDKWFNDRFFGRNELIYMYGKIVKNRKTNKSGIIFGKDGWLFMRGDGSLENFQNSIVLTPEQMQQGLDYLVALDKWCRQHNKKFYYVIVPGKGSIYGEYFDENIKKINDDSHSVARQFIEYIHSHSNIKVFYLYDALIAAKPDGLLYYKRDTHWNLYGGYIGYQELMRKIAPENGLKPFDVYSWHEENHDGDLYEMYIDMPRDLDTLYKYPDITPIKCKEFKREEKTKYKTKICDNSRGHKNLFILHDSFERSMEPYILQTFNRTETVWKNYITNADLDNIKNNYDIVILENTERYTPQICTQKFVDVGGI